MRHASEIVLYAVSDVLDPQAYICDTSIMHVNQQVYYSIACCFLLYF